MPFEKKKKTKVNGEKYKDFTDYTQKSLYFDISNTFQAEGLELLKLCGHKQAKFLGLLIHDYLMRNGINLEQLDKKRVSLLISILEEQCATGVPMFTMSGFSANPVTVGLQPQKEQTVPEEVKVVKEDSSDEFISEEDKEDMEMALGAWG